MASDEKDGLDRDWTIMLDFRPGSWGLGLCWCWSRPGSAAFCETSAGRADGCRCQGDRRDGEAPVVIRIQDTGHLRLASS